MSTVRLHKPPGMNPEDTHRIEEGTEVKIPARACPGADESVTGTVVDRGYTIPTEKPVYLVIDDNNGEWTALESEIQNPSG